MSIEAVAQLNNTIADFERETNVQVAVVVVNDFDHDKEDFDFAYELFNTWGKSFVDKSQHHQDMS